MSNYVPKINPANHSWCRNQYQLFLLTRFVSSLALWNIGWYRPHPNLTWLIHSALSFTVLKHLSQLCSRSGKRKSRTVTNTISSSSKCSSRSDDEGPWCSGIGCTTTKSLIEFVTLSDMSAGTQYKVLYLLVATIESHAFMAQTLELVHTRNCYNSTEGKVLVIQRTSMHNVPRMQPR